VRGGEERGRGYTCVHACVGACVLAYMTGRKIQRPGRWSAEDRGPLAKKRFKVVGPMFMNGAIPVGS